MTLEEELARLLSDARLEGRQARAVCRRLGWDGHGPTTLAAAGGAEGYTRERVRQLEGRLRRHVDRHAPCLPITVTALRIVEHAAPAARTDLARLLATEQITARPFDPVGVLLAAELAQLPVQVLEAEGLIVRSEAATLPETAVSLARALGKRHGATNIGLLTRMLAGSGLKPAALRRLLELRGDVTWLDEEREWLVVPARKSRAVTGLRKMLSVARSLTLADVDDGLRRSARPVALPREILRALCRSFDWIAFDPGADVVSSTVPLDAGRTLSPLERELIRIFRTEGPVLGFRRAVDLAADAGLNRTSVGLYLGRTPVLQTVARGRYAVRGALAPG
ncbi:MAG TPA: hypothetical protein VNY33_04130 [Gaiellaceae bacterium]|nr:hypothetical protein [Gaiellaceae bacterium]